MDMMRKKKTTGRPGGGLLFRQNRKCVMPAVTMKGGVCALRSGAFAQASYHAAHDCSACALTKRGARQSCAIKEDARARLAV